MLHKLKFYFFSFYFLFATRAITMSTVRLCDVTALFDNLFFFPFCTSIYNRVKSLKIFAHLFYVFIIFFYLCNYLYIFASNRRINLDRTWLLLATQMPNNALTHNTQCLLYSLIHLQLDNQVLCCHSIVWHHYGDNKCKNVIRHMCPFLPQKHSKYVKS